MKKTKDMTEKQAEKITKALYALKIYKFQYKSCYTLNDAQQNLQGRTHYVDPDTLRYFKARIVRAGVANCFGPGAGLVYKIVESLQKPGEDPRKNKRAAVFDCFGSVIFQSEFYRTTEQANKAAYAFMDTLDLKAHYTESIKAEARRRSREASGALAALAGRKDKE